VVHAGVGVDPIAAVNRPQRSDPGLEPDRQLERLGVALQVVGDLLLAGEMLRVAGFAAANSSS